MMMMIMMMILIISHLSLQMCGGLMAEHDDPDVAHAVHHLYYFGVDKGLKFAALRDAGEGRIRKVNTENVWGTKSLTLWRRGLKFAALRDAGEGRIRKVIGRICMEHQALCYVWSTKPFVMGSPCVTKFV
jgi:hypothetical protein